ncbi:MAG TPA: MqnA/MqnD/SBP family protein [bacterium]|nr:MqnA/MqnD/SBP family protein [bacterium]
MKRSIIALLAASACLLPLSAMGGKVNTVPSHPALEPIVIQIGAIKGPTGIGAIRLFEDDPVLPDNARFGIQGVASADAMVAKMLSGELDAAVLPVNMAAKLYNAGQPYSLLAVVGNGMVKLVTTDATITSIADLKGRDVYVAGQGATPEYLLRTIMPKYGIDADKDVHLIFNMPYPELAASVVAGRVAIAVLPEPFATLALKGNAQARVPFSLSALWSSVTGQADYPMSVFVIRAHLVAERPEAVAALLADYRASITSVIGDPAAAGELVERYDMGLKAPIATAAIPSCAFVFIPALEARASIEALLSVFLAAAPASIGSKLPDEAWYASVKR